MISVDVLLFKDPNLQLLTKAYNLSGVHALAADGRQEADPVDRDRGVQGHRRVAARDRRNRAHEGTYILLYL